LVDARWDAADQRAKLRDGLRKRIATILMNATGCLPPRKAEAMAILLLHLLKALPMLVAETAQTQEDLVTEARELVRLYVASAFNGP
jgi:hypothetical protein